MALNLLMLSLIAILYKILSKKFSSNHCNRIYSKKVYGSEKEKEKYPLEPHNSKSEKLTTELLKNADSPRADDFSKILEDLFIQTGLIPTINENMLTINESIAAGDGSILESNASPQRKPTCSCHSEGIHDCDLIWLWS